MGMNEYGHGTDSVVSKVYPALCPNHIHTTYPSPSTNK